MFIKELLTHYDEPKPHYNTVSTIVRGLEEKGYISYKAYGNTYQYYAAVDADEFRKKTLKNFVAKYFDNSFSNAVSSFIEEEELSVSELKDLIRQIENKK